MSGEDIAEWAEGPGPDEFKELQRKVGSLEREVRRRRRLDVALAEMVHDALVDQPVRVSLPKPPKRDRRKDVEIAVAHCSDVQMGKVSEDGNYDSEIAAQQVDRFCNKIIELTDIRRSGARIDELHLFLGGDMVEGETIFPTQPHQIDASVLEQAVRTSPRVFASMVAKLLGHFQTIHVACVPGNHGRPAARNSPTHPETNWDSAFYEILRMFLHGPDERPCDEIRRRVSFNIAHDAWHAYVRIFDWGCLLMHGDKGIIAYLGTPIYGINRRASGWGEVMESIGEPWDYLFLGHFHVPHHWTVNYREVLINGTTERGNLYARAQMASGGHPCQRLCFFNARHGIVSEHQVWLTERGERLPARIRHTRWSE